jgi:hypothetical protein
LGSTSRISTAGPDTLRNPANCGCDRELGAVRAEAARAAAAEVANPTADMMTVCAVWVGDNYAAADVAM